MSSIVKKYKQLHDMNMFGRVFPEDLMPKQKRDAFFEVTLIKDKRSGKIKVRACADGRSQRAYIIKE